LIVGNYYVLTLLVFITATACALAATKSRKPVIVTPRMRGQQQDGRPDGEVSGQVRSMWR